MGRLFGTDGIRGEANRYPMDAMTAFSLGQAITYVLRKPGHTTRIIVGKDTRISGYMLESALQSGITSMGGDPYLVGVLPTPGIAFITESMRADAGLVISASHNPYQDNGIKVFSGNGSKLSDAQEEEIEELMLGGTLPDRVPKPREMGRAYRLGDADGRYIVFLKNTFPRSLSLEGVKIAVDASEGRIGLEGDQRPRLLAPDDESDARIEAIGRIDSEDLLALVEHLEPNARKGQCEPCRRIHAAGQFRSVLLEELQSGRRVEEKVPYGDRGAHGAPNRLRSGRGATLGGDQCAGLVLGTPGDEHEVAHGGDTGQGLAAKAERPDLGEVLEGRDLGCGMRQDAELRVLGAHARAIIDHADQVAARAHQLDDDPRRASVEGVLDQFLDHGGGALHHFARGDLVGDAVVQYSNAPHAA